MKSQTARTISIALFVTAAAVLTVNAQVHNPLVANVPFDFYIGDHKLYAGEYVIESVNKSTDGTAVRFAKRDGKGSVIAKLSPMEIDSFQARPAIVAFNHYGAEYFFTSIKNPGEAFGARAIATRQERELARQTKALIESVALTRRTN